MMEFIPFANSTKFYHWQVILWTVMGQPPNLGTKSTAVTRALPWVRGCKIRQISKDGPKVFKSAWKTNKNFLSNFVDLSQYWKFLKILGNPDVISYKKISYKKKRVMQFERQKLRYSTRFFIRNFFYKKLHLDFPKS